MKPGVGGDAARVRGSKVAASQRAAVAWEREHPDPQDPAMFGREILPRLSQVIIRHIAELTALSKPYRRAIIRGERVPHPRWWPLLSGATDGRVSGPHRPEPNFGAVSG